MKKLFLIFILLFLNSCVPLRKNNTCGDFVINIENDGDTLFLSSLSKSLKDKLSLVKNNKIDYICKINLNLFVNEYSAVVNESGYANRKNFKISARYVLSLPNNNVFNNVILFYGANISENYYSEYVNENVRKNNDINILSEKIFYSIISDLKRSL